ncbi:MAG TPA: MTH938/NDUFAF3 family protein [Devosiaceae bacterium]|nr:MTH938/NDUFAF3 family protein [Devosiaceae bacterium]
MAKAPTGRDGHYPYQTAIDAYGDGGFRFAGMSHRGSLLCLPAGMFAWSVTAPQAIDRAAFAAVLDAEAGIEVLLVGTGDDIVFLPPGLRDAFGARGIGIEPMSTGAAVRTYNVLLDERRKVGAALIAVERAR